jgi:hypothetical protein
MGIVRRFLMVAFLAWTALPGIANAADISAHANANRMGPPFMIRLSGEIVSGDSEQLARLLERLKNTPVECAGCSFAFVEMSSPGGLLSEGLRIGYLLQQHNVGTIVRAGQSCLSACALAFLGGTRGHSVGGQSPDRAIEVGARVGFHSFYLSKSAADRLERLGADHLAGIDQGKIVSSLLIAYAVDMRIDPALIGKILPTRQEEFVFVETVEDLLNLDIKPLNLPSPKAVSATHAVHACNHYTGWIRPLSAYGANDNGHAKVMTLSPAAARTIILSHFANQSPSKSRLFTEIRNALSARGERKLADLYKELEDLGLPVIDVSRGTTFHVSGWGIVGAGFYVMACIWNASAKPGSAAFHHQMMLLRTFGISKPFVSAPMTETLFMFDRHQRIQDLRP